MKCFYHMDQWVEYKKVVGILDHRYSFHWHLLHLDCKFREDTGMRNYKDSHNWDQDILQKRSRHFMKMNKFETWNIYIYMYMPYGDIVFHQSNIENLDNWNNCIDKRHWFVHKIQGMLSGTKLNSVFIFVYFILLKHFIPMNLLTNACVIHQNRTM